MHVVADSYGSWPQDGSSEATHFTSLGSYYSCLEVGKELLEDMDFRGRYCHLLGSISLAYDDGGEEEEIDTKGMLKPFLPPFSEFFFQILPITKVSLFTYRVPFVYHLTYYEKMLQFCLSGRCRIDLFGHLCTQLLYPGRCLWRPVQCQHCQPGF